MTVVAPLPLSPAIHKVPTCTQTLALIASSPALARLSTRTALSCWSLDEVAGDAELIVSELVTNAVRHARPVSADPGDPGQCRLTLEQPERDTVRLWVSDSSSRPVVRRDPGDGEENGRGLNLVDALAVAWGVFVMPTGGKSVWAELKASGP